MPSSPAEPPFDAWLTCPGCARSRWPLAEVRYRCPDCGGLLEIEHDLDALRQVPASEWRARLDQRAAGTAAEDVSGVWAQREWVLPGVPAEQMVTLGEGRSPLLPAPRLAAEIGVGPVYLKQCGTTQTGSFKDLGMTVLISQVNRLRAAGRPIRAVACASTGDTSAALAAYGARAGLPTLVILPADKVSTAQLIQPVVNGARVIALETDFDGCMAVVQELTRDGSVYLANSMNPLRLEGQKTLAVELCRQLGWRVPDWVVLPGGNLGNVFALYRGFALALELGLIDRLPRLAVAQAAAANPLYLAYQRGFGQYQAQTARDTVATAIRIGAPVSFDRAVRALTACDGVVEQADENELAAAAALANREGFFCCPHTAVALAALHKLASGGQIGPGQSAVVVSTAHGLKFVDWMVRYHEGRLSGVESAAANPPTVLPADLARVCQAIDAWLG